MHDRDRQVLSFLNGKMREYEGGNKMKNPKSLTTFLEGFNLGTILSLISLGGVLLNSQTIQIYSLILILIVTNGVVVGVVRQYLLIQLTLTKNMTRSFKQSKNQVPSRLLEMRNYKLADTLKLLVGISARLRMNMCGVVALMLLLVLTLLLPIIYTYRFASNMTMFSLIWSFVFLIYTFKIIGEINQNYHYLQNQITYLLEIHQFNRSEVRQKQS